MCAPSPAEVFILWRSDPAMYFKQFYLGCLAHASYLVGSDGEAVVVDPQRDVEQYVAPLPAPGGGGSARCAAWR